MTYDPSPLWRWMELREAARRRKESGAPPPYSDDPVIRRYRFCNVRREDDRVTRWIDARVRRPFARHPHLWFMLCAARTINWPPTLGALIASPDGWPHRKAFSPEGMLRVMRDLQGAGEKVFTGAYVVPPAPGYRSKAEGVALKTLGQLWAAREGLEAETRKTLQGAHAALVRFDGWGPFMAYQAVVDMRFTPLLRQAPDRFSWAAAGPGTLRGLNRLRGRPLDRRVSQARALDEVLELHLINPTGIEMDLSDVPNALCETDKYLRAVNGEGEPKALYVPGRGC